MKRKPQLDEVGNRFDAEEFIKGARDKPAEAGPSRGKRTERRSTGRGKMAAAGYTRTSLDLPDALYEQIKITAVKKRCTMRECVEEAMVAWLKKQPD